MVKNRLGQVSMAILFTGTVGLLGLGIILSKIGNYSNQIGLSEAKNREGSSTSIGLFFLQKKFLVPSTGIAEWYPSPYPKNMNSIPRVASSLGLASSTPYVATYFVQGRLSDPNNVNSTCNLLSNPIPKYQIDSKVDCAVVNLSGDTSLLSALQPLTQIDANKNQVGMATLPNTSLLSPEEKKLLFSPNFKLPVATAVDSVPVKFVRYKAKPENSRALNSLVVQVNSTMAEIPVGTPLPPNKCQLALSSNVTQPIDLSSGDQTINFDLKTDSIALKATLTLNGVNTEYDLTQFQDQYNSNYGKMISLSPSGLGVLFKKTDISTQTTVNPQNPAELLWTVTAQIQGTSGNPVTCTLDRLRVKNGNNPPPPYIYVCGWLSHSGICSQRDTQDARELFGQKSYQQYKSNNPSYELASGNSPRVQYGVYLTSANKYRQVFVAKGSEVVFGHYDIPLISDSNIVWKQDPGVYTDESTLMKACELAYDSVGSPCTGKLSLDKSKLAIESYVSPSNNWTIYWGSDTRSNGPADFRIIRADSPGRNKIWMSSPVKCQCTTP